MTLWRLVFTFTLVLQSETFELQDTIHKLIEENIHLHDKLENLTKALRELKWMLIHHSTDPGHHEKDVHQNKNTDHVWDEWSQHGISEETHLVLEQAFCRHNLHTSVSAAPVIKAAPLCSFPSLILSILLLINRL